MRLIDADALRREVGKLWETEPDGIELCKEIIKAVNHAHTIDAMPVVRCKDCKYFDHYYPDQGNCEQNEWAVHNDWFCADGERMATEDE